MATCGGGVFAQHGSGSCSAHLQAAEVLQGPQFAGAVGRRRGQHLVDGGEADGPDAAAVAPKHPQQAQVGARCQRPQLGRAVLGTRRQQLVVGRHGHAVDVLQGGRGAERRDGGRFS